MLLQILALALLISSARAADCADRGDGTYEVGCKTYVTCNGGVGRTTECPEHQAYSSTTKQCDFESRVGWPCGLVRDCSIIKDGSYADKERNCTSYYTCAHHTYYGHNYCTPGTVFENTLQTCVWPDDAFAPCGNKMH